MTLCGLKCLNPVELKRFQDLVLDKEVNINYIDPNDSENNYSPLLRLCRFNEKEQLLDCVTQLLKAKNKKINDNAKDANGDNALIILCANNNNTNFYEVVKLILENTKIEINHRNLQGDTALFTLCTKSNYEGDKLMDIITLLTDKGATIEEDKCHTFFSKLKQARQKHKDYTEIHSLLLALDKQKNSSTMPERTQAQKSSPKRRKNDN